MTTQHNSLWDRIPQPLKKRFVLFLWFVTWAGLIVGMFDRVFYEYVVIFSAAHALLVLYLVRFRVAVFPAQIRIAYFVWVAIGTYVPHLVILMYITTIGVATNLFVNYCPLARMMYLFPWNREEPFSFGLVARVFLTPPVVGKFKPRPSAA